MQKKVFLAGFLVISAYFSEAMAVKVSNRASVTIVDPATINESFNFDSEDVASFEFIKPYAIIQKVLPGRYVQKMPQTEYVIGGLGGENVQVMVESSHGDVMLENFVLRYKDNNALVGSAIRPSSGKTAKLKMDADIVINASAEAGYHQPEFTLSVYYE